MNKKLSVHEASLNQALKKTHPLLRVEIFKKL